ETATTTPKNYPAELQALLERGHAGDASVLPELKQAFDHHPEMAVLLGDLVRHAEQALLGLVAGPSVTVREAVSRQVAQVRTRLAATATSALERLLIDRIAISWLEVYFADIDLANHLRQRRGPGPPSHGSQKRLDASPRRYRTAINALT